jgi:hypothetical protein
MERGEPVLDVHAGPYQLSTSRTGPAPILLGRRKTSSPALTGCRRPGRTLSRPRGSPGPRASPSLRRRRTCPGCLKGSQPVSDPSRPVPRPFRNHRPRQRRHQPDSPRASPRTCPLPRTFWISVWKDRRKRAGRLSDRSTCGLSAIFCFRPASARGPVLIPASVTALPSPPRLFPAAGQ